MNTPVSRCEHPKMFYSKKAEKEIYVSCGKCLECRKARQARWVVKLQRESQCHLYTQVVLLEYDDVHVPYFDFSDEDSSILEDKTPRLFQYYKLYPHLRTLNLNEIDLSDDAEYNYVLDRLNGVKSRLAHCSVYDIQNFKKRLNTKIKRKFGSYGAFRSAFVAEYGSTTFRPHYHGILFFDDERILKELPQLVRDCWVDEIGNSLGFAKVEADKGHFASYISKYITKPADIPKIYEEPQFKPFFVTSRRPPIGSLVTGAENKYIFDNCTPKKVEFVREGDQVVPKVFPIGKDLENRIFPKCPLYGKVSSFDRSVIYRLGLDSDGVPYNSFNDFFSSVLTKSTNIVLDSDRFILPGHLFPVTLADVKSSPIILKGLLDSGLVFFKQNLEGRLVKLIFDDFLTLNSFKVIYSMSRRIFYQVIVFNSFGKYKTTFNDYLNHIFEYYDYKKPLNQLRDFYREIEQRLLEDPDFDLRYYYPLTFYRSGYHPEECPESQAYYEEERHMYYESTKSKRKNDYFESKRLKAYDYSLYLTIKNYYYAKECNEAFEAIA